MVVFDTTTIILALDPLVKPPTDLAGQVVSNCKERIEHLLNTLHKSKTPIFDKQIAAISKSRGADRIYTDDDKLAKFAQRNGIEAVMTWEIPLPPEPPQLKLGLDEPKSDK